MGGRGASEEQHDDDDGDDGDGGGVKGTLMSGGSCPQRQK